MISLIILSTQKDLQLQHYNGSGVFFFFFFFSFFFLFFFFFFPFYNKYTRRYKGENLSLFWNCYRYYQND